MQVQGVTVSVSDLARSKAFYEDVLGFVPGAYYAPTRWQPYEFEGRAYFAIIEVPEVRRQGWSDVTNFDVEGIESFWERVRDKVVVETALSETPWGSLKFVIHDPDGWRLGFVGKKWVKAPSAGAHKPRGQNVRATLSKEDREATDG
jgi:catechol 2,3-dioxygenase-like lactoylglutathione lyase family enzyme